MSAPAGPVASRVDARSLDLRALAIVVAAIMGVAARAIGDVLLIKGYEQIARNWSFGSVTPIVTAAASIRPVAIVGAWSALFVALYPRLPVIRRAVQRPIGTFLVGAVFGTIMLGISRALMPYPGLVPLNLQVIAWLADAMFCGPVVVWVITRITSSQARTGSRQDP